MLHRPDLDPFQPTNLNSALRACPATLTGVSSDYTSNAEGRAHGSNP